MKVKNWKDRQFPSLNFDDVMCNQNLTPQIISQSIHAQCMDEKLGEAVSAGQLIIQLSNSLLA